MKNKFWGVYILKDYFIAVMSVICVTAILWLFRNMLDKTHIGLFYLLVIAYVATISGTRPAMVSAFLSFLLWNFFFIVPVFTFAIRDYRDWILLSVFFIIGITIGQITGKLKLRQAEAMAREKEIIALYKATLSINSQIKVEQILQELVEQVFLNINASGCAVITVKENGDFNIMAGSGLCDFLEDEDIISIISYVIRHGKAVGLSSPENFTFQEIIPWPISIPVSQVITGNTMRFDVFIPIYSGEKVVGLMYAIPQENKPFSVSNCRLLIACASNVTTLLDRQRLMEETAHALAMSEAERIKSVLFSSLSHNLKTPLASLSAILSSLCQEDGAFNPELIKNKHNLMVDDVNRLTENIEKLLDIAQLESGNWIPQKEWFELIDIISIAVRNLPEIQYKRLKINIPEELPLVCVDSVQISQVIRHLVENGLSYSSGDIEINASYNEKELRFSIDDGGYGIPEDEMEKVFLKFYRGRAAKECSVRGTGLGLAICREIIQAHRGNISVGRALKGGASFSVSLPLSIQE